jgi:hypothetical protein
MKEHRNMNVKECLELFLRENIEKEEEIYRNNVKRVRETT